MNRPRKIFRSFTEFCAHYYPKSHKAGTCNCRPKPAQGILVVIPRPSVGP